MTKGTELIAAERQRQIEQKGWTAEHDRQHSKGELVLAAITYAMPLEYRDPITDIWPWGMDLWKPTPNDRVRELVKAGALIAAEIDRLLANKKEYDILEILAEGALIVINALNEAKVEYSIDPSTGDIYYVNEAEKERGDVIIAELEAKHGIQRTD